MAFKYGLLLLFAAVAYAEQSSPCPEVFQYKAGKKTPGQWEGDLTFKSEFDLSGMWIRVLLDKKADKLEHESAETDTDDHKSWLIRMQNDSVKAGEPKKVHFSIKYTEKEGEPKVVGVRLNARDVCPQKKEIINISPCPGVFKYTNLDKNEKGQWHGELTFSSEFPLNGIWVRVHLDNKGEVLADGFGEVKPRDNNSYLIYKKEHFLKAGDTLRIPFVVKYEDANHVPNVKFVRLNGRTFCENKLVPVRTAAVAELHDHAAPIVHNVHNHPHHH